MEGLITGTFMSLVFLFFLILLRRKYNIPVTMMIVLYVLFTVTGTLGGSFGAVLSGLSWVGKRLHMLVAVDAITLTLLCKLFKKDESLLGDYLAIPVVAVCAAAKVGCLIFGCCYGIELYVNSQGIPVRFPSPAVELTVWVLLAVWLFFVSKKGRAKGLLWPIAMIWVGVLRFLVDFMRGSLLERTLRILGLPAGQLWSLVLLLMGVAYLFRALRKSLHRNPSFKEMLRGMVGWNAS